MNECIKHITLVIIISCLLGTQHVMPFSLKLPSITNYIDEKLCTEWGYEDASALHQEQAHIFLGHLGLKNPNKIPIRKFSKTALKQFPNIYAVTRPTGIWINENALPADEKEISSIQLFVLAHESSHFALQYKRLILLSMAINSLPYLPIAGLMINALINILFFTKLAGWLAKDPDWIHSDNFKESIKLLSFFNAIVVFSKDLLKPLIPKYSQKIEKGADLAAAKLLCESGYSSAVEARIQQCKENIEQGFHSDAMHPNLEEEKGYLEEFLAQWQAENQEQINAQE